MSTATVEPKRPTRTACVHCSLPVPSGRLPAQGDAFCCTGCEAAYAAIRSCGLEEFYALREKTQSEAVPALEGQGGYEAFDDDAFTARHCRTLPGGLSACEVYLEGMHCAACVWLLERAPRMIPGLKSLEVDYGRHTARAVWNPNVTTLSSICRSVASLGYRPSAVEPSATRSARAREERAALVRLGVAGACAGNVMLLAFALYSGVSSPIGEPYYSVFRWLSAAIGVLSIAWPGRVFFVSALAALRTRAWSLDAPVALALFIGATAGVTNVVRGSGEIYFDTLTMLVFLLLGGRWLQSRHQRLALDAVELLFSVMPRTSCVIDADGERREVASDALEPGMVVEIRANDTVPADGIIVTGEATLDESILTGESTPVVRTIGEPVWAGALNISSVMRVRVESVGRATRVGRVMALIERLSQSRTPVIGSAERVARPFVGAVLLLAAITFAIHVWSGVELAIEHAVALLIVCCPCAAALATPIATTLAIAQLARRGTLVKGGDVFEAFDCPSRLLLDKTGTVTDGRFLIRDWVGDESLRPVIAAMETGIAHPIAATLAMAAPPATGVTGIAHAPGLGVSAVWQNHDVLVGSQNLMRTKGLEFPSWVTRLQEDAGKRGQTVVCAAVDGEIRAAVLLGDEVRADSPRAVEDLTSLGFTVELLSGDAPGVVENVAQRVGVPVCEGAATPERKHERVGSLVEAGERVVMVGDGVNDASALAAATAGVAVSGGAEASLAAADVYMREPGLAPLVDLARVSRRTVRAVRRCLTVALAYNAFAASLAVAGLISPLVAAIIMPISSLSVVSMAVGSVREKSR